MHDVEEVAVAFDRACRAAGVAYAFIGGLAVLAWGQPRATMDVDALVQLERDQLASFVAVLLRYGFQISESDIALAIREHSHATAFDADSVLHVDLKFVSSAPEREEVQDAIEVPLGSTRLRIARPENVVAFKVKFGSPQDLADARSILVRQGGAIDDSRLMRAAERLGIEAKLRRLKGGTRSTTRTRRKRG